MNNKLLYFPYINIPDKPWSMRSVLYWDDVGAIVPSIYREKPNHLERNMLELVKANLVTQVFPGSFVRSIPNFDESFLKILNKKNFDLEKRRKNYKKEKVSKIHVEKLGNTLVKELVGLGIANKSPHEWGWYYVESKTARLFMMYLATLISKAGGYTPATDNPKNIDFTIEQKGFFKKDQKARGELLKDLMPYFGNPDFGRLRKFKDKNHDQLKDFRNLIEATIIEVNNVKKDKRKKYLKLKVDEINYYREIIYAKLNESKIGKIIFGSIFGLTQAVLAYSVANQFQSGFEIGNAIYEAFQGYDNVKAMPNRVTYLALLDKELK